MKSLKLALSIIFSIIIVSSCTVEKRHHESGYHIEWRKNNKTVQNKSVLKSNNDLSFKNKEINKTELESNNLVIESSKVSTNFGKAKNDELILVLKENVLDILPEKELKI